MNKETNRYQLPAREIEILYAIWNAGRPLLASEIASEELKLATVHTTLKRMLKKNLLEVVDFAKSGNVFGRCYQPTISIMEFELDRLSSAFESRQCTEITLSKYIAALLDNMDKETALRELENLEKMIAEKRKSLAGTD